MSSITTVSSYEEACERHRWEVPPRYNIASDVCDRHAREKLAMVHEDPDGRAQEVMWGQLQDDSARFANVLSALGVEPGDRVAMLLPPTPLTAAAFFGAWKTGAILLSMSVLYGDEGIRHRLTDSQAKVLVTNEANADRIERSLVEHLLILDQANRSHIVAVKDAQILVEPTSRRPPARLAMTQMPFADHSRRVAGLSQNLW